ncbi:MAG TPA: hypothetical protein VM715_12120 [Candidatus Acidoferrum sp.]|nr:hypothetical protein [Candidatus Acidoferrum sp.]
MVSTLLTLAVASLALVLVYALLRRAHTGVRDNRDWEQRKHAVDVAVFRVILDRNDENQLRRFLAPNQFAKFQRRRIHLAVRMLRLVDENAGMAMELARLAKMKSDSALAAKIDAMIATAFQLRLNLLLARLCLYLKWVFPSWPVSLPEFEVRYQHLLDSVRASSGAIA